MGAIRVSWPPQPSGQARDGDGRVAVVVPARDAASVLDDCLASIMASGPREVIVVDGMSTDGTVETAMRYPLRVMSDGGEGFRPHDGSAPRRPRRRSSPWWMPMSSCLRVL